MRLASSKVVSMICLFLVLPVVCVACLPIRRAVSPESMSTCERLFRLDPPRDDSLPPRRHVPQEARVAFMPPAVSPPDTAKPRAELPCQEGMPLLVAETVVEEPGKDWADFCLSPRGRQIALRAGDQVTVLDLNTGKRRELVERSDFLLFWTSETVLMLAASGAQGGPYELDLVTGQAIPFQARWAFNDPYDDQFKRLWYTGWQAMDALEIDRHTICRVVDEGRLTTVAASDGSLLLPRDELLAQGGALIREAYPALLSLSEIQELVAASASRASVVAVPAGRSPITHGYWPRALILRGLPSTPHNLLVYASTESLWQREAPVGNQLTIDHGGVTVWAEAHPEFFIARDPCPDSGAGGYRYILYRKGEADQPPAVVGRIPYPIAYGTKIVWSPDERYIYFKQSAGGRWSVSRIRLPEAHRWGGVR